MCGIYGFISSTYGFSDLERKTNLLIRRGPDSGDYYYKYPVGLGHRRLSIIDLETGSQPMKSEDGNHVIVFNGEIYNFKKIRLELINLGFTFQTQSDTEVILKAYKAWGLNVCLEKFEGMFAFAIWDNNIQKLFVVRDRFGEKPLFYTKNEAGFFFASELKSLDEHCSVRNLSKTALNIFFNLTYIPAPYTIYENVFKLEPSKYIEIDISGKFVINSYYQLEGIVERNRDNLILNYSDAKIELRNLLFNSIEERMVSDVPLGSFLSGGIDSSIISAIMAKISPTPIKTFSIGFKEKAYDESERAALVAQHIGSDHTLHVLDHEDLLDVVDETLAYFDEPFGDSSSIPSMMVAKKAREKVTVVLTGDCADELFGGYEKYLGGYYADRYNSFPRISRQLFESFISVVPHNNLTNTTLRKIKKVIQSAALTPEERYLSLASLGYQNIEKINLLNENYSLDVSSEILKHYRILGLNDELTQTFFSDVNLVLEGDMLTKVDRACMINSLEARVPFLDSKIVDFSFKLPHEFKILNNNKKRILKDTFREFLPQETLAFSKKGFGLPLRIWFRNELKDKLLKVLNKELINKQGIFRWESIDKIISDHMNGKENNSAKLWLLYVFQNWYFKSEEHS